MKAIIIGASSGIGRELAKILSKNNCSVGLAARNIEKLVELQKELPGDSYVRSIDVTHNSDAREKLHELIDELGGLDLIVIGSGVGYTSPIPDSWECDKKAVEVNVCGFMVIADEALKYFIKQGFGHIVGVSSVTNAQKNGTAPAFNASKVFVANYLEGIRQKVNSIGAKIFVTDIRPGLVNNDEVVKKDGLFLGIPPEKAASQVYKAIVKKKKYVYITKRWSFLSWMLRLFS